MLQVAGNGALGRLPEGYQALLAALAEHAKRLRFEVDALDVEPDQLRATEPARVGDLEHRAVAAVEGCARRDAVEQPADLVGAENARQLLAELRVGE